MRNGSWNLPGKFNNNGDCRPQTPASLSALGIIGKCKDGKQLLPAALYRIKPRRASGRSPALPSLRRSLIIAILLGVYTGTQNDCHARWGQCL